jgi:hypothetical protein
MDTKKIIDAVGGRKAVMSMTGLTKGRISQWAVANDIPTPWLKFFEAKFPELDWPYLRGEAPPRSIPERRKARRRSTDS